MGKDDPGLSTLFEVNVSLSEVPGHLATRGHHSSAITVQENQAVGRRVGAGADPFGVHAFGLEMWFNQLRVAIANACDQPTSHPNRARATATLAPTPPTPVCLSRMTAPPSGARRFESV